MTAFPDWVILILGIVMIFGGYRSIKTRKANTDVGEYEEETAVKLGWFWIVFGGLFLLAVIFDIGLLKRFILFFLENKD